MKAPLKVNKKLTAGDSYDVDFSKANNIGIQRGFNGEVQFNRNGKVLIGKEHSDLIKKYSKYNTDLKKEHTKEGVINIVKAIDPSGFTNYPDAYRSLKSDDSVPTKLFNVASALPVMDYVKTPTKLAKVGTRVEKTTSTISKINNMVDNVTPKIPYIDRKVGSLTPKLLDKVAPTISKGFHVTNSASTADKINLGISFSNTVNKTGDVLDLKNAYNDLYESYKLSEKLQSIKNNKNKTKQYAMGGLIRPSSRKRHIAPLVLGAVSAATSVIGGISTASKAKKAKEDARIALLKQEQDAILASKNQQAQADAVALADYNEQGNYGIQYYKDGGAITPKFARNRSTDSMSRAKIYNAQGGGENPNLPISNGGYQTKGGNLVPIGDGVELAVGNRHNDTKIDGVSGIQLSQGNDVVAEVEDNEVVADGHTVYSDRLKYKGNKSYADMMVALTKKRNKLEARQDASNSKAEKNTIDRTLAGLNMAEETLFKTQEVHKEMEGKQVLSTIFANGGRVDPRRPLPVPKWMETFTHVQQGGKYDGYGRNALNDYRDPNNPNVIISENGNPKYPYEPVNVYKPQMLLAPKDTAAGMDDGSGNVLASIVKGANTIIGAANSGATESNVEADATITNPPSAQKQKPSAEKKSWIDWKGVADFGLSLAPNIVDNIVNASLTRNTPELPKMLNGVARPMETRVNVNPVLADAKRRQATLRRNILDNTSNSNNAKSNMIASSIDSNRQIDEILVNKENQEMALRNANAQNQQAVANANAAQQNQRSMMEYQRRLDMNTQRSANITNLVGDIKNVVTESKLANQFDASVKANLMDDPEGSKAIVYAQDKVFMSNPRNRKLIYATYSKTKNPKLLSILEAGNYNINE